MPRPLAAASSVCLVPAHVGLAGGVLKGDRLMEHFRRGVKDRDVADSRTMPDSRAPKRRIRSQSSARASGEILKLVAEGNSSKEIATLLGVAPASVDIYRSRLMFKLNVADVTGLVRFAIRHGVIKA